MMQGELCSFIKAWIIVTICLTYCYFISSRIPKGKLRLLSILPIIPVFTILPLIHSSFFLQFYFGPLIGWLANFRLLLFAFGKDDTLSINPSIPLFHFILLTTLPIKIKQNKGLKNTKTSSKKFFGNLLVWCAMVHLHMKYTQDNTSPNAIVVHFLYSARMIYGIQVHFAVVAAIAKALLRQELEPQFNRPRLSTSLTDFWGKRWNLMMTGVLRSTIHEPTRSFFTPMLGKRWAVHPAILATFIVSGLMHEVMHFYVGRRWPTWEVMWFFVIHGVCVSVEVEVKKKASKSGWKLQARVSRVLSVGFVMVTGIWLCYAELVNWGADVREIEEYAAFVAYVKHRIYA